MKQALELCSLATNPNAPSPTAGMVKVEDGFMVAYVAGSADGALIPIMVKSAIAYADELIKQLDNSPKV